MFLREKRVKLAVDGGEKEETSGGKSEWWERADHPLLNDLILGNLFGYARRFDLKACRVVSKKWNLRTIPHMHSTFKLTIHGSQFTQTRTGIHEHPHSIDDFVKLFQSNELRIPFTSFKLEPFCTTDGVGQQFLQLCGETATEIDLNLGGMRGQVYTIEDVSILLRSCPKLQILGFPYKLISRCGNIVKLFPDSTPTLSSLKKITFGTRSDPTPMMHTPSAIVELLTAAPNVSDLVVHDADKGYWDESASNIRTVLNCIETLRLESSIQSLSLFMVRSQHIEQLQRMVEKENGLKLKSLNFEGPLIREGDLTINHVQLVTIFRHTLQHLNVGEREIIRIENILTKFPSMPNLKSLTLRAGTYSQPEAVDLNEKFPALETLDFEVGSYIGQWGNGFSQFLSSHTLKSLFIRNYGMRIQTFNNIRRVFPNLTKLGLKVEDDGEVILGQIWSQMTGLESLSIECCIRELKEMELDSVFTGIPTQTLLGLTHVVNEYEMDKMTVEERRERIQILLNEHSRLPSVRNLANLTHLQVHCRKWTQKLCDITPYLTFSSMNHLRHLEVAGCMLTNTCCEMLTKETGLESWAFQNDNYEHIIPPFLLHKGENHCN